MTELRPVLAVVGLLVVAAAVLIWFARSRGWRLEWWERFFSPGRRKSTPTASRRAGGARGPRTSSESGGRPRAVAPKRAEETSAAAGGSQPSAGGGAGSAAERQGLIDLDFLPLLDPKDAVRADPLGREFDMGDLGAIEVGAGQDLRPGRPPTQPDSAPVTASETVATAPSRSGRDPAPRAPAPERESVPEPVRPLPAGVPSSSGANSEPGAQSGHRELLIVLTIITQHERDIAGRTIREAFQAFDLRPDGQGMFHHFGNRRGAMREPVFSVSNVLDPGVFELDAMDEIATPGLCLFMRRPGPLPATVAFDLMMDVGTRLARALEAALCDDQRCRLTVQATQALRERVVHFALRHERGASNAG